MLAAVLLLATSVAGQDSNRNYVLTRTLTSPNQGSAIESIAYADGLGRPAQEVQKGVTPSGQDLVTLYGYDGYGREQRLWLPVPMAGSGGFRTESAIGSAARSFYNDIRPYAEYGYEASPVQRRISEQGPGEAWEGKAVAFSYSANGAAGACPRYRLSRGTPVYAGDYEDGTLLVTATTDEDGRTTSEFKNGRGLTVMVRQTDGTVMHDTRYVYDARDNLRCVLPPEASVSPSEDELEKYAFQYTYNGRNLCTEYKLPGCGAVYVCHDEADRPVLQQDGMLRAQGKWAFTFYDAQGRVTVEGIGVVDETSVQSSTANAVFCGTGGFLGSGYDVSGMDITEEGAELLKVNYYDNYLFLGLDGVPSGLAYAPEEGYDARFDGSSAGKGRLTGTRDFGAGVVAGVASEVASGTVSEGVSGAVSETVSKAVSRTIPAVSLASALYYDAEGRLVQQRACNPRGGIDTDCFAYSFSGKPLKHKHTQTVAGGAAQTEVYSYAYDHAERVTEVRHQLNALPEVVLLRNSYDELGRIRTGVFHGSACSTTYSYNTRSLLTGVDAGKFAQSLYYTDGVGTPCYNGNISSMTWQTGTGEGTIRGYKFSYDGLDRLTEAGYGEGSSVNGNPNLFTERVTGYDRNGNITGLQRYGQTGIDAYGLVDDLTFTLDGNRLNRVDDAVMGSAYNGGFEFRDGAKQANEYTYDANGNLTKDLNKNILDIQYNCLNLPSKVTFGDESTITYTYAADGTKLRTVHTIGGIITTTDYCGNVVYENGVAKLLLTEVGYVTLSDNVYHYYVKDHQGNNRVVVDQNGSVEETNHYYPFGGIFASTNNVQPYKYNGKELDTKKGLNWYDYGARHYDAVLGRFITVDPMAEKYYPLSPYTYCGNNPILFIDKSGMDFGPGDLFKTPREAAKDWGMYYNGASIIRKREMGSSIYEVRKRGTLEGYSYSEANISGGHRTTVSGPSNGEKIVATIHSHGNYDGIFLDKDGKKQQVNDNIFSPIDLSNNRQQEMTGFLATPNGSLLEHNPKTDKIDVISTGLPSDPNDPSRKNRIEPQDNIKLQQTIDEQKNILEELYNVIKNLF